MKLKKPFLIYIYIDGIDGEVLINSSGEKWRFYKSHSAEEIVRFKGIDIFNDLIIYIIRNPLDVFCSYLNYLFNFAPHRGGIQLYCESIDQAKKDGLIDEFFSAFKVYGTLNPYFYDTKSWMENVEYWLNRSANSEQIIVVRYEDLVENIYETMNPILYQGSKK